MKMMPIDGIEDWEMRIKRQDAFWDGEIIDRPCMHITFPRPEPVCPMPKSHHATHRERWMDSAWQAERTLATVENTVYMGDALPHAWPDLGPDYFPALYGGELVFEESTSYIKPFLKDWADADSLELSREHPYWKKMEELCDTFLEVGKNRFHVGYPDLHPGADCLVGIRGPQEMAMDLFDEPDAIQKFLPQVTRDFFETFDYYHNKLAAAGQACTCWAGIVSSRKWNVPSNDFSYMIAPGQFDGFFLEGLREESEHFAASLHHLDGPGCLNHLDSLLGIETLNAIQWVWGAGNGKVTDWIEVFQKIQAAGKGLQLLHVHPRHLDVLMENLRPEGVWMWMEGVENEGQGEAVLEKAMHWK